MFSWLLWQQTFCIHLSAFLLLLLNYTFKFFTASENCSHSLRHNQWQPANHGVVIYCTWSSLHPQQCTVIIDD